MVSLKLDPWVTYISNAGGGYTFYPYSHYRKEFFYSLPTVTLILLILALEPLSVNFLVYWIEDFD